MKKSLFYLIMIGSTILMTDLSFAQAPAWLWAKGAGNTGYDEGYSVAADASGNTYVTGSFDSPSITFGAYTLTNSSTGTADLFLVKYDAGGNVVWATNAGGAGYDAGISVAVDASGNVFLTGEFYCPAITFGSYTLTNIGNADVFIVKYDASGNVLWAASAGGTEYESGQSVAADAAGNAYLCGAFSSSVITFGSFSLTNGNPAYTGKIFMVKYDAYGNVIWAKSSGGTNSNGAAWSVAVDASGNSYVTGSFTSGSISFDSYTLTNSGSSGSSDLFLVKYDGNGNALWAKSAGGINDEAGMSAASDATGNTWITGFFESPAISFGSFTLTNNGIQNIFLAKYDNNGNPVWAKSEGGTNADAGMSVALDASGNPCVSGMFLSSTIIFGPYTITNAGNYDIFLAKYDAVGNVLWAKSAGGPDYDICQSVAVNASGNAYITGNFYSPQLSFGSDILTNAGNSDFFLAKLESFNVGTNEDNDPANISVYPNPACDKIMLLLPPGINIASLRILNIEGEEVLRQRIERNQVIINIRDLPQGSYFLRMEWEEKIQVKKFIKI